LILDPTVLYAAVVAAFIVSLLFLGNRRGLRRMPLVTSDSVSALTVPDAPETLDSASPDHPNG